MARRAPTLQDKIASAVGVMLPDGRRYRNGVISSAADVAAAEETRARDAGFDAIARQQAVPLMSAPGLAPSPTARPNPTFSDPKPAWAGGGGLQSNNRFAGSAVGGGASFDPDALALAGSTLASNAGRVAGRNYSPAALALANPTQIMAEATRLPKLIEAQTGLRALAGALPGRDYTDAAFARATPDQTIAEFAASGQRLRTAADDRRRKVDAAGLQGLLSATAAPSNDIEARATQIENIANATAKRVADAGGNADDILKASDAVRRSLDPTGEIPYARQQARDQARIDAQEKVKQTRADESGLRYLQLNDELTRTQSVAKKLAPEFERAALQQALSDANYDEQWFGTGRDKVKSLQQAVDKLKNKPEQLSTFLEAYSSAAQNYAKSNELLNPEVAAAAQRVADISLMLTGMQRRGELPTANSEQMFIERRNGGKTKAAGAAAAAAAATAPGSDVMLDANTGLPITNSTAAADPARASRILASLDKEFPRAPAAPAAPRWAPTISQAWSNNGGLLSLLAPSAPSPMGVAMGYELANLMDSRPMQFLNEMGNRVGNLPTGLVNYGGQAVDGTGRWLAGLFGNSGRSAYDGVTGAVNRGLTRADNSLASFMAPNLGAGDLRATQERILMAQNARLAAQQAAQQAAWRASLQETARINAARQAGLPDDASPAEIMAARRANLSTLR